MPACEIDDAEASHAQGDGAVDVGAHKGGYLYWLQRQVGPRGRALAFEPQVDLADYLRRAMAAIGARHVVVEPMALSDRVGTAVLHQRRGRPSCGATLEPRAPQGEVVGQPVPLTTLDQYVRDHPMRVRALKCDVEGHELAVLRGAAGILERDRPALLVESAPILNPEAPEHVFRFLGERGYEGLFLLRRRLHSIRAFDKARHQRQDATGRPMDPYAYNFIFLPDQ